MSYIAVLVADTQGGIAAVAGEVGNPRIIPGTVQEFDGIQTYTDARSSDAGGVNLNRRGWIALAEFEN